MLSASPLCSTALRSTATIARDPRDAPSESFIAQKPQQCRNQGEGHDDGNGHGSCGSQTHRREESNIGNHERKERDEDRSTGKDHRRTSGACSHASGIRSVFGRAFGAVPRQDKQGVVNTHGQANHHGEDRSDVI